MISILFYGTPEIARISLAALLGDARYAVKGVVTQPDRPSGRKQALTPSPVKALALENNITVIQPERIKSSQSDFISQLATLGEIDIAVVVAFGQILPEAVLRIPRCGSLNLHASLLPRWRGAAPIQRAIMAGDSESGVCLMQMGAGLDTGAVFISKTIPISEADTAGSLHAAMAKYGAQMICQYLSDIVSGSLTASPQNEHGITYAQKISDDDAVINWQQSARLVSCQIRAMSPKPGAYTLFHGKRLKLFNPTVSDLAAPEASAGTLRALTADSFSIACSSGSVTITEVQLEGRTRVSVAEFLKGNPLAPGTQFTSM